MIVHKQRAYCVSFILSTNNKVAWFVIRKNSSKYTSSNKLPDNFLSRGEMCNVLNHHPAFLAARAGRGIDFLAHELNKFCKESDNSFLMFANAEFDVVPVANALKYSQCCGDDHIPFVITKLFINIIASSLTYLIYFSLRQGSALKSSCLIHVCKKVHLIISIIIVILPIFSKIHGRLTNE